MLKIGDKIKAQGIGTLFVSMVGGSGIGKVLHVGNPKCVVTNEEISREVEKGEIDPMHLEDGLLYRDEGNSEILWLADGDFVIIG